MSTLVPITVDHVCLALTAHTTIHASQDTPLGVAHRKRPEARTVCGSDAFPLTHRVVDHPDQSVYATWPPPIEDRCVDCARILGLDGRQRRGCKQWQGLVTA